MSMTHGRMILCLNRRQCEISIVAKWFVSAKKKNTNGEQVWDRKIEIIFGIISVLTGGTGFLGQIYVEKLLR